MEDRLKEIIGNVKFNNDQLLQIELGIRDGLNNQQISMYSRPRIHNPYFKAVQMEQIRLGLKNNLSTEKIELYAKPSLPAWMMYKIRLFLQSGISFKTAKKCINSNLDDSQLIQVLMGFENGLEWDQVKTYASHEIPYWTMESIRKRLEQEWN